MKKKEDPRAWTPKTKEEFAALADAQYEANKAIAGQAKSGKSKKATTSKKK